MDILVRWLDSQLYRGALESRPANTSIIPKR